MIKYGQNLGMFIHDYDYRSLKEKMQTVHVRKTVVFGVLGIRIRTLFTHILRHNVVVMATAGASSRTPEYTPESLVKQFPFPYSGSRPKREAKPT